MLRATLICMMSGLVACTAPPNASITTSADLKMAMEARWRVKVGGWYQPGDEEIAAAVGPYVDGVVASNDGHAFCVPKGSSQDSILEELSVQARDPAPVPVQGAASYIVRVLSKSHPCQPHQ